MNRISLTLAVLLGLAQAAAAGEAQDRLFAVGVLEGVATGQSLIYSHERSGQFDTSVLPLIEGGEIAVLLAPGDAGRGPEGRVAQVTLREAGRDRALDPLPATAGHPLLLVFLETVVSDVATLTGGSPFYIRNRMREALRGQDTVEPVKIDLDGTTVSGERLVFRPFTADSNRAELGDLADLEIRVTLSDAAPGRFERLEAVSAPSGDGPPAFSETIVFERLEEN